MKFELRPVEEKDLKVTLEWRNDPEVLKYAQTPNPISMEEHAAMYKFNNAIKLIFLVNDVPAGFVAFTRDPDFPKGEWSFHLSKEFRGKGLSELMLKSALYYIIEVEGYVVVTAAVKKNNEISNYLHQKLGFEYVSSKDDFYELKLEL